MSVKLTPERIINYLGVSNDSTNSIHLHSKRIVHRAALNWLTWEPSHKESSSLTKVEGYLNAFHHYCDIEEWAIASKLLIYPLTLEPGSELCWSLFKWGCYPELLNMCQSPLLSQAAPAIKIICYKGIGLAHHFSSKYELAISNYMNCLRIAQETGNKYEEGNALGNLGLARSAIGKYGDALKLLESSLEIMTELGDKKGQGNALGCIGLIYESIGQHENALTHHQKHLTLSREIRDRWEEGNPLGEVGKCLCSLGRYQEAIIHHQARLEIANEIDDQLGKSHALRNLGYAHAQIGQHQTAINYCNESQEVSKSIGDKRGEGISIQYVGEIHLSLGQKKNAKAHLEKALAIFQHINWIKNQREVEKLLAGLARTLKSKG